MKTARIFFLLLLCCGCFIHQSKATHAMGVDLTYVCLGGDSIEITVAFYRDCEGVNAPNDVDVDISSVTCNEDFEVTLPFISVSEITPVCTQFTTECQGGTLPGAEEYIYRGIVELPAQCVDWELEFNLCCRNFDITTIDDPGGERMHTKATLDNLNAPCNSSPEFSVSPVPFVCDGQNFCFNNGGTDADGDSLVYYLITPLTGPDPDDTVTYLAGYSATNPLTSTPALSVDSTSGDVCMTPSNSGETTILAIMVEEWRNGVKIGSVIRDMQLRILSCPSPNTIPTVDGINGTNVFTATICSEAPYTFTTSTVDPDAGQTVVMDWNSGIPNATFTISPDSLPVGTFSWTPTAADISNTPHCFVVSLSDDNCPFSGTSSLSFCITVVGVESAIDSVASPSCPGSTDGTASVSVTGGVSPYTYQWSDPNNQTTAIANLAAGTYTVTVTDSTGCYSLDTAIVTDPDSVLGNTSVTSNYNGADISCFGGSDGAAQASPNGGSSPYTYLWDANAGGQTTATATNLSAGTFSVTITDSKGCDTTVSITLTEPTPLNVTTAVSSDYNGTDISCFGFSDGALTATPAGGTAGYTYAWSSGGTGATANGLAANTYSVTVTDANSCTATTTGSLMDPPALSGTIGVTTAYNGFEVSCFSGTDGGAQVSGSGGNPGYTYAWDANTGNQTTDTATALAAGTYSVVITDTNGCTLDTNITLTQPPQLVTATAVTSNFNGEDVSCFGSTDGTGNVISTGGVSPFTYLWDANAGSQTTSTPSGLSAGTYSVTITDNNGCTVDNSLALTQPTAITSTSAVTTNYNGTDITCFGQSDGAVEATPAGGTLSGSAYSFLWDANASNAVVSNPANLSAGLYFVTVTDDNGCSVVDSVTVTQPPLLTLAVSVDSDYNGRDVTCTGAADGAALATAGGGTTPYQYQWDLNANNQTTALASNLIALTYAVTLTDVNGCQELSTITLVDPPALVASTAITTDYNGTDISCFGLADGGAAAPTTGGTPPYAFAWDANAGSQPDSLAINLAAGTYVVSVTDTNGCQDTHSVTLAEPPQLTTMTSVTTDYNGVDISCFGLSDGGIAVTPTGGNSGYTFAWGGGAAPATTAAVGSLPSGTYTVTVTDQNGCSTTDSIAVSDPLLLTSATSVVSNFNGRDISCFGAGDGEILVVPTGGTGNIGYQWDANALSQTTANATNLVANQYFVTLTDVNGCSTSDSVTLVNPPLLEVSSTVASNYNGRDITCTGLSDGEVLATPAGGTTPYAYQWDANAGAQITAQATALAAGTYFISLTDANNCLAIDTVTLIDPPDLAIAPVVASNFNGADISCYGFSDGEAAATTAGGTGAYVFTWGTGANNQTDSVANTLASGTYAVTVSDANGCTDSGTITLVDPPALSITLGVTSDFNGADISCFGLADGAALATPSGGLPGYQYQWGGGATGQTTPQATNLSAGTYTVTVSDINGCSISDSIALLNPPQLNSTGLVTSDYNGRDITCFGDSNGVAIVQPFGGTGSYGFNWGPASNNQTTAVATFLPASQYTVTITDDNGCTTTVNLEVEQPDSLSPIAQVMSDFNGEDVSCFGSQDGAANVTHTGGTGPFNLLWDATTGNQSTAMATSLTSGTYQVTVTDINGCTATTDVALTDPPPLTITTFVTSNYNGAQISCFGAADGALQTNVLGGVQPYAYTWSANANGAITNTPANLADDQYAVTVTDINGCTIQDTLSLYEPAPLVIATAVTSDFNGQDISCPGAQDGEAEVTIVGGTGQYNIAWGANAGSQTTLIATSLTEGAYTVVVNDANACQTQDTILLVEPTPITYTLTASNPTCFGVLDGQVNTVTSGGTLPYSYTWSNGATGPGSGQVGPGTYAVTIADVNGCATDTSVTLIEPGPVNLSISPDETICPGITTSISAQASGGVGAFTYIWTQGLPNQASHMVTPNSSTIYAVSAMDGNGCQSSVRSVEITVLQLQFGQLNATPDTAICPGQSVELRATYQGGNATVQTVWSTGNPGSDPITVSPVSDTGFAILAINQCNDTLVDSVFVEQFTVPTLELPAIIATGCAPLRVEFALPVPISSIDSLLWTFDGTTFSDRLTPTQTFSTPGIYDVTLRATSRDGCDMGETMGTVEVFPVPSALFTANPIQATTNESEITFTNLSEGADQYAWNFGDGESDDIANPIYDYVQAGNYTVVLIASNIYGCSDQHSLEIQLDPVLDVQVPNAFSPNPNGGNGGFYDPTSIDNDVFFPVVKDVSEYHLTIFNRWGELIFESFDPQIGWDGYYRGVLVPLGVYAWKLEVTYVNGQEGKFVGDLTVLR